jgi:uncharacterized repeat protein (TIGR01451 family)
MRPQSDIEFFSPSFLMGFYPNSVPTQSARFELTPNGLVRQASAGYFIDGRMAAAGGLIYTSEGSVFDPWTLTKVGSFGVSGIVASEQEINRICFLTGSDSTRVLRIFDLQVKQEWGAITITNVLGTASRLIRCGGDRVAFRTSAGQLFVVRSSALSSGPATDLGLTVSPTSLSSRVGQPVELTLTVTNLGPNHGASITVANPLPTETALVSSSTSSGTVVVSNNCLSWTVGDLPSGSSAVARLIVLPKKGQVFTTTALLNASSADMNASNNIAVENWFINGNAAEVAVSETTVQASEMV